MDKEPLEVNAKITAAHKNIGRFWLILGLISVLGLMGLSAWRQGWFTPTEHLYLELNNGAQGLQVGTLVKLKGFKIGEVDGMTLEPNLNVHVNMRVAQEKLSLLGADAEVRFTRDTPISAKYIEFVPGTKDKGTLTAGATVALHQGDDVEDMMLIVKGGVEKLNSALGKLEPILDDAKKLTGEAASMRQNIHSSVDVTLKNIQSLSADLKDIGHTTQGMVGNIDKDRAIIMGQVKNVVQTIDKTVANDVPQIADSVKQAVGNVKKITTDAAVDLPPTIRGARSATEDIAEITDGAKKTWPISSLVKDSASSNPLPLDAFEANK